MSIAIYRHLVKAILRIIEGNKPCFPGNICAIVIGTQSLYLPHPAMSGRKLKMV